MAKTVCRFCVFFIFFVASFYGSVSYAQKIVEIQDGVDQHIFNFSEIEVLEDQKNQFTFEEIASDAFAGKFKPSLRSTPQTELKTIYWFKIKIKHQSKAKNRFLLEFF